jgi:hypothetical protein
MGRPLNKKYFGTDDGLGGESLLSVALGTAGSGYSQGLTATVADPALPGGVTATVTVAVNPATGAITGYSVVDGGNGYLSAPTVTLVKPTSATATYVSGSGSDTILVTTASIVNTIYVGMTFDGETVVSVTPGPTTSTTVVMSGTVTAAGTLTFADTGASGVPGIRTLTNLNPPALKIVAFITDGSALEADIIKQTGTSSYLVATADGTGVVTLTAADDGALVAGQCSLAATDVNGSTYYVTKLTAHRALLVQNDATGDGFEYPSGATVAWDFAAPVREVVQIAST